MPNGIKYSTNAQTLALKKGNYWIGTGDVDKGPTSSTDYWNGITPPSSGYTIYLNKASNGPSIYVASNDSQLITITNNIAGASYTTVNECFNYFNGQSDKMVFNRDMEGIVTNGLILYLDAGFLPSYPRNGTAWNDLSGSGNNGTLINGPTFDSANGGSIVFDGSNDYGTLPSGFANFTSGITFEIWTYPTATSSFDVLLRLLGSGADTISFFRHTGGGGNNYFNVNIGGVDITPNQELNLNQWSQRTFTANGTNWFAYNEGMSGATVTTSKLPNNVTRTINEIGGTSSFGQYTGRIAIIRLYNRALSATEVLQNYNAQKARFGI